MFDPAVLAMSDEEYITYLINVFSEHKPSEAMTVQVIGHDVDNLVLYLPRYERYASKILQSERVEGM